MADLQDYFDWLTGQGIDLNALCGPCAEPASPQSPDAWEISSDNGVTWSVAATSDVLADGDRIRYECPGGYSTETVVSIDPQGNIAVGLDAPVTRTAGEGGNIDLSAFTCSDGTPINSWEVSFDDGLTWVTGFTPNTVGDVNMDCTKWRFKCDGDYSDAELTYDITATNTYQDLTIQITEGTQGFFSVCFPCGTGTQRWQVRIDDAEADEDHALSPNVVTGDRPNSDPGNPEPVDQAWRDIAYYGCKDCATFDVEEVWPTGDGVDPDSAVHDGEKYFFYLRTSCDGGATWQPEITVTMET